MLRTLAITVARYTPQSVKSWIHHARFIDNLSRKAFGQMLGNETIVIETGPLKGFKLVPGQHVSHAHVRGVYEPETLETVDRWVKPGFICYDLGASIGYISLLMARKARHVYAFDPAPHAAAEIRKHAAANQLENITVIPLPVSNNERDVSFAVTDVAYGSAIKETETPWPVLKMRSTTLDAFAQKYPPPDFIKIDVEGEEGRVLEGAGAILRDKRPSIFCEVHSQEALEQVLQVTGKYHYRLTTPQGESYAGPILSGEVRVLCLPE